LAWVNRSCGILVEYHFFINATILFSMKEFLKGVNKVNRVFYDKKTSISKRISNRLPKKSSFPGCSKRARCKALEILRSEAYLAVRRNDEG
jgi:hypothetical protein